MKIGICDDEFIVVNKLKQLVEQSLKKYNREAEIFTFLTGSSLIERVEELDAVFLDVKMPEMDGYEVGNTIKNRNPSSKIIMATGRVERFKESFKINAFRFVTKPFDIGEIEEAIEAIIKMEIGKDVFPLYFNRIKYDILQKNIKFFKAFNGYTEAKVENKIFYRNLSLNEIEELIDNRLFIRVHKQFIVNMYHVTAYKNGEMQISGIRIPVSRRKQKEVEKKLMEFDVSYRG